LLPIEGDEVYNGAARRFEEVRLFKSQRPGSLYSAGSDRGEP
jgi:inositol hexakisphosphate/diphosphoinositol-pentakisphosphate kinase